MISYITHPFAVTWAHLTERASMRLAIESLDDPWLAASSAFDPVWSSYGVALLEFASAQLELAVTAEGRAAVVGPAFGGLMPSRFPTGTGDAAASAAPSPSGV